MTQTFQARAIFAHIIDSSIWKLLHTSLIFFTFLLTPVVAQGQGNISAPLEITLPFPADQIYPGGEQVVVAVSQRLNRIAIVDLLSNGAILSSELSGEPVSVMPFKIDHGKLAIMAIIREATETGRIYSAQVIEIGQVESTLSRKLDAVPSRFAKPAIIMADVAATTAVVWDRDIGQKLGIYKVLRPNGETFEVAPAAYPFQLISIDDPSSLMSIEQFGEVSLVSIASGAVHDGIQVDGLLPRKLEKAVVFVPDAFNGGTGSAVVVNSDNEFLTILSVDNTGSRPRLSPPLQTSLRESAASRPESSGRPLVAADRDLTLIAVGTVGRNQISIYRRIISSLAGGGSGSQSDGRGLEKVRDLRLSRPIQDVTVLESQTQARHDSFVFLAEAGTRLLVYEDLGQVGGNDLPIGDPDQTPFKATDFNSSDIRRLQRLLATLGYTVGAVDGAFGVATQGALRSFQIDRHLEPSNTFNAPTLEALNSAAYEIMKYGRSNKKDYDDYVDYIRSKVDAPPVDQVLDLGTSHRNLESFCFGLNGIPPRSLWENSVDAVRVLANLKSRHDLKIIVMSGYRSPLYGRCASGGDEGSHHINFRAFDLRVDAPGDVAQNNDRLASLLRELRAAGGFIGGVGISGNSVHFDTRGVNVDF